MSRPYTGFDKYATGPSPALRYLVDATVWLSAGRLTNLGIFGIRPMRSKAKPSVHGTGRAADIGFAPYKTWPGSDRHMMTDWIDFIIANADDLGVELLIDYSFVAGAGGGRAWKCDRHEWANLVPGAVAGAGEASSKWVHIELSPAMWDDVIAVKSIIDHWEPDEQPVKKPAAKKAAAKKSS